MSPKEIQQLISFISKTGLAEVNIETDEFKIKVKRDSESKAQIVQQAPSVVQTPSAPQQAAPTNTPSLEQKREETKSESADSENENLIEIKSPMIGTFYRSPSPDKPPFVSVGDSVAKGSTVCIVEAMKLFNEIESEIEGKIVKVMVEDATPVEYDQVLFLVEPS